MERRIDKGIDDRPSKTENGSAQASHAYQIVTHHLAEKDGSAIQRLRHLLMKEGDPGAHKAPQGQFDHLTDVAAQEIKPHFFFCAGPL